MREKLIAPIFAIILVTASLGGALGPASSVDTAEAASLSCSASAIQNGIYQLAGMEVSDAQKLSGYDGCTWTQEDSENISETDGYAQALGIKDSIDASRTTQTNFQQDTRKVAYTKAKISLVNDLNNGTSESVAEANANQEVSEYYSRIQYNNIQKWNNHVLQIQYLASETPTSFRHNPGGVGSYDIYSGWENSSVTLANGTSVTAYGLKWDDGGGVWNWNWDQGEMLQVQDPDSGSWEDLIDYQDTIAIKNEYDTQETQVTDNMASVTSGYYAEYQAGDLSSDDLARLNPSVIASEAATDYNSTGYYSYAAMSLAAIGASGNVNTSHTVSVGGSTFDGTLYYTGDDVSSFETGSTYNMSQLNGTFYMAVQTSEDSSRIVNLESVGTEVTIDEATNTDTGESVQTTETEQYVYETTNASALADELDKLRELRQTYEDLATENTGGGGGGLDPSSIGTEGIIAAVAVAALVLFTRE